MYVLLTTLVHPPVMLPHDLVLSQLVATHAQQLEPLDNGGPHPL